MAWTAEKVKAMRESNPSKAAESSGWTAEKVRAIRTKTPNPSTASSTVPPKSNIYADALQQYTERHASDMGEVDARNEPSQAHSGRGENLSPFPSADAARERSSPIRGALLKGNPTERALDMGQKWGVPAKSGNVLENVGSGAMAYGTGRAQELRASFAKDSVPDEFDRINQWLDTGDNKNLADAVRRVDNTHGAYTDADLIKKGGWTQAQIDEARKMNAALDAIPAWQRGVRRTANTIGGIADTVAAAPVLGAEYGVQAGKNIAATMENWEKVRQEVKDDEHAQSLFDLLTDVDMDYNPTWPESRNRELISMGYNSKEIREMRQKLAGLEVSDGIDKNQSVGYQLYDRGQQLTAAAQSGLSPAQRAVSGAVTSAAENLAVAGVNPAAVLPVLSAQGAAEAMGQSAEKGESAGKALGGGLSKFGAGWAINSVGAADLAKTMGSDYAKDTLAGQIADWVQGLAGSSELAQRYPAVAAAISGGIDNSMQAFAETYADMAIDAALGDSEAAKNLFSKDTLLTALESGLSGGASGALGGAVGTGLAKLNGGDASLLGQTEHYDQMDRMKQAAAQQKEWEARAAEPSQSASPTAPPEGRATGVPGSSELDAGSAAGREMAGLATEGSGSGPAQQTLGAATREQSAFLKGNSTESMQRAKTTAAKSENPAVRQFAEVAASDSLTGKTIGLFTPNAENRENRAAFEQAYGVTLPDTAAATRRMLREIAAQQKAKSKAVPAVQSAELPNEAVSAPQTVQDAPTESADAMPETAAPDNVREATAAVGETDSYENAPLRETLGLRPEAPKTQREAEVQRALEGWRVTDKAAETISKNMPDRVDADRYAAAASPLYRLGRSGADTFAQALELAGSMSGTAADINYILSTDAGRTALEIAYTQGKGERMLYAEKMTELGGALGSESTSGKGEVYAKGTMRQESDPASQIISLNAAATGTDAVLRDVLQNDRSIRAYVDTETARIFFGDNAQDIFGTVLHEDYHWYNALDAEGARTLQEHALEYLAKSSGYESLDEMVRAKLEDYSAQSLTYEQAAEELVADAWRGIFDSEESFKRWVTFQRGQAEKNAGKSGAIHKVMEQVRQMLDGLISRAKEVLTINPDNRAALKAKRLAEAEKRTLQDEYFAHAEKAMEDFFGRYTTNLINETSMKLLGYDRATVKNYYPIAVDRSTLATEIEGVKMDATSRADVVVQSGKAYTAALTLNEGYWLISIKVTMGGEDVTATAWNEKKMTVSIPDVTGNIVITAEAKLPMLKELAVGAVTKLVEKDGAAAEEFVVIAQDYEKELNGEGRTLLARRHGITEKKWNTTWCTYADSLIDVYLNSEYLKDAPQALKDILTETKFYYTPGYSGSGSSYTGSHTVTTLSRKVFLPSCYEFGFESYGYTSASSPKYYHLEGSTFADAKKLALALLAADAETAGSVPNTYFHFCLWTRTPVLNDYGSGLTGSALKEYLYKGAEAVWAQMLTAPDKLDWGGYKVNEPENMSWPDLYRCWTHPCFTLPGNTVIDAKGNIVEVREE